MAYLKSEFEIVSEFTNALGLRNQTDGTLHLYHKRDAKVHQATKPDGYYYYDGITFILDAKAENAPFTGQLFDYMQLEQNENFIGFMYNGATLKVYVNGVLQLDETTVHDKFYYKQKYFPQKINNFKIINEQAHKLANLFRDANIDKQLNVPFIGAVFLNLMYAREFLLEGKTAGELIINTATTKSIIFSLKKGLQYVITDIGSKQRKRDYLLRCLDESTLNNAKTADLVHIVNVITSIYNFINISESDYDGNDIMNNFLRVFRKWNSANSNEKGEVFTPDHIAQLMFELIDVSPENVILDPTCGSGTFLTNAMNLMLRKVAADNTLDVEQKHLLAQEIKKNHIIGIEINDFNATLAGINMLLHGDGCTNIWTNDCFAEIKKLTNLYDRVLMNPPFSIKIKELSFVKLALDHMQNNGFLATILPKSVLKGTEKQNVDLLKEIFQTNELVSVISLPNDLFLPNAGVATVIAVFYKNIEKQTNPKYKNTLFINMSDDGFVYSGQYREMTDQWHAIKNEVLNAYKKHNYNELRALTKVINYQDELLFESFNSHRPYEVAQSTFVKTIRENLSAKMLCGYTNDPLTNHYLFKNYSKTKIENLPERAFQRFKITDLLYKIEKGREKHSIDRKLENKYISGVPLLIAKKDNNGVGGLVSEYTKTYANKFAIITGGDGGGGKTYYCDFDFAATSFVLIADLKPELQPLFDDFAKFYLATRISERLYKNINHGRTISELSSEIDILLPVKPTGEIDTKYMSDYIKNLKI
ncbi:HsdM family class I SAM-dependent methyltransferase [Mycoplasmopsis columbinasalis]|uniref:site-specific DNA-methyltransferase (adenine-specific) n=1 Tax=Mycoplasmopsis columbinasalis TaxID=114880 RepID=A0A449B9D4_9BACT|nr:N-6 DNA methylase [Mycoplasmopsis columbinasalis]VEU77798.1 Restriction enzyme BgcI subunit alpha [Mycoplasmopsis columbinasalis]